MRSLFLYKQTTLVYNVLKLMNEKILMKAKNILIFNPFGIGDVLFTTPLIRNLKDAFPESSITYLCNRRTKPILDNNVFLKDVIVFEKDEWRESLRESKVGFIGKFIGFRRQIKKGKFDLMFDLSMNSQYGLFFKLSGVKRRLGLDFKNRGRFLTDKIKIVDGFKDKHVARYYLDLLGLLGVESREYKFDLEVPQDKQGKARASLENYGLKPEADFIGICPGSGDSWQQTAYFKRWPKEHFLKISEMISEEYASQIILFGSKAEKNICDYVYENMHTKPLNLCGKISLEEFITLVSISKAIITNDGGPFHIAQALNKKVIAFFGPVDDKVYGAYPDSDSSIVFKSGVECRPCYKTFKFSGCGFDKKCLRDISPKDVFSSFKNLC